MRARDLVLTSDAAVLLGLLAGWFFFAVLLVLVLIFIPQFLAVAGWGVLAAAVDRRAAHGPRIAHAGASPPPAA